jgi:hypothetical protein
MELPAIGIPRPQRLVRRTQDCATYTGSKKNGSTPSTEGPQSVAVKITD